MFPLHCGGAILHWEVLMLEQNRIGQNRIFQLEGTSNDHLVQLMIFLYYSQSGSLLEG